MDQQYWQETRQRLKQYLGSRMSDAADVEDLLQDVLTSAFAKREQLRDEQLLTAWIYRIARNALIDYYRRADRASAWPSVGEDNGIPVQQIDADRTREFSSCIVPMIRALPEPYREALLLSEIGGLSQKELALRLGISYSGAKSRVQRGREKLRDMLLACCHIETDRYGNIVDYHSRHN